MGQITVFSGPERRRRWSAEDRFRILSEAFAQEGRVTDVARRYDVSTGLIYTWRRKLQREFPGTGPSALSGTGFAQAVVVDEPKREAPAAIVLELTDGRRMRISASTPPALAVAALKAVR